MNTHRNIRPFLSSLVLLVSINMLIKPIWVLWADRQVQNTTGLEAYGGYFALLNLCMVLNFLLDIGLTPFVNRTIAAHPTTADQLFAQAFSVKVLLSLVYSMVVIAITWATGVSQNEILALIILLQVMTSMLLLLRAVVTGHQHFQADAWLSVSDKAFVILAVGLLFAFPAYAGSMTITRFLWIQVTGICLSILQALFILYRSEKAMQWRFIFPELAILRSGLPFALNIFFMSILLRVDGFLIERLLPEGAYHAGVYASAFRLVDAINMMGAIVAGFLLPYISNPSTEQKTIATTLRWVRFLLMAPAIVFAIAGWTMAEVISAWLYPGIDPSAVSVIRILLSALPGLALVQVYGTQLTAMGHIRLFMLVSGIFAIVMLLTNLWVIPEMGTIGAAWVAVTMQSIYGITLFRMSTLKSRIPAYIVDLILLLLGLLSLLLIYWLFL